MQNIAQNSVEVIPPPRPVALAVNIDGIPTELKAIPRWVLWRYIWKPQKRKWDKPPFQANGHYANHSDPATWTTFENTLAAYQAGGFDGIGIALSNEDDCAGVDIDHVVDRETGEVNPQAEIITHRLPTYWELSPSGTGLRAIAHGRLPGKGNKSVDAFGAGTAFEMYETTRYLTITGQRFNGIDRITDCTEALAAIHTEVFGSKPASTEGGITRAPVDTVLDLDDADLLDMAHAAKNGAKFTALWSGDLSAHGGDHSGADQALANLLAFWTGNDANRMDKLFRRSGLMRPKWDEVHHSDGRTYGQATIDAAIAGTRETYSGRNPVETKPAPAQREEVATGENPYRGTDDSNAALFLHLHGSDVRFCPPWDKWLLWSGSYWRIDERMDIDRMAADVPRLLYRDAADAADSAQRKTIANLARGLENTTKRANMLTAAKHRVVVHHSDLDKGHFLLNVRNGTINLTTGQLRPHDRADLLTHDTEIHYDRNATSPTWLRFLHDVFAGDADLIQFVQKAVGYSLTGDVREQVLLICYGVGSNGKSVFLNILRKLLGRLAWQAAPDLLMADRNRRHPTEQADLFGKRLVVCQETGEGRRFNETLVKQLTGGDAITARRMHEDNWSFDPTHKLWLSTNHKPEIKGTDYAIWRRPRLIPFGVKFTDDGEPRKDPLMEARLIEELPGILAWSVAGCLDWQKYGLGTAEAVKAATASYQAEMDVLAAFFAECCILQRSAQVRASAIYRAYTEWCERSGEHAENQRKFGQRLNERGLQRFSNDGVWYRGIGLRTEGTEGTEPIPPIFRADFKSRGDNDKKGSVGSVGSVNQSAADPSTPHPILSLPVDCKNYTNSADLGQQQPPAGDNKERFE